MDLIRWLLNAFGALIAFAIVVAVMVASMSGCAYYAEIGVGHDKYIDKGTNPRSLMRVRGERECGAAGWLCFVEFNHHSSIRDGWPFNERSEDLTNQWSIGVRIPIGGKL